jgi:hypothetical protein
MPNGVWGTNLGVMVEENDEGRSRRHSGSSTLEGFGTADNNGEGFAIRGS